MPSCWRNSKPKVLRLRRPPIAIRCCGGVALDLTGLQPTPAEVDAVLAEAEADKSGQMPMRATAEAAGGTGPTDITSIACWPRRITASAGPAAGSTWPATPTPTATRRTGTRSIWPYRDWVIRALNADMPFDQFTIEQIAGDMLPGRDAIAARSPPAFIATRCSTKKGASTRWNSASTP